MLLLTKRIVHVELVKRKHYLDVSLPFAIKEISTQLINVKFKNKNKYEEKVDFLVHVLSGTLNSRQWTADERRYA